MIAFNHAYVNNFMWTGIDQSGSPVRKSATQAQPSQPVQSDQISHRDFLASIHPENRSCTKVDPHNCFVGVPMSGGLVAHLLFFQISK